MVEIIEVFVDSSWRKAGIYCEELGWALSISYGDKPLQPDPTNHGEFEAMRLAFMALTESIDKLKRPVFVFTDSWLVYKAVNGNWNIKKDYLKKILTQIFTDYDTLESFGVELHVCWIPREKNKKADELTHE